MRFGRRLPRAQGLLRPPAVAADPHRRADPQLALGAGAADRQGSDNIGGQTGGSRVEAFGLAGEHLALAWRRPALQPRRCANPQMPLLRVEEQRSYVGRAMALPGVLAK